MSAASSEILQIRKGVECVNDIKDIQLHTYTPYTSSFNNNDEIRITIQSRDLCVLPSDSYLFIEFKPSIYSPPTPPPPSSTLPKKPSTNDDGKLTNDDDSTTSSSSVGGAVGLKFHPRFTRLSALNFFSELRYEVNGVEIDRCKVPHITHELKTMMACRTSDALSLNSMLWLNNTAMMDGHTYRLTIPLKFLFGFCEDYNKVLVNCKHDLILMRDHSDTNVYVGDGLDNIRFDILKIHWKIPHITLSDPAKQKIQRTIDRREIVPLPFRSWDMYELPNVPETNRNIWSVKTTTHTTKPRYVIVAFQTNRNHVAKQNPRIFDHCDLSNVRLYLNNERYPYDDMNLNFQQQHDGNFTEMYNVLGRIQYDYYNGTQHYNPISLFSMLKEKSLALFAFDCSRSDESSIQNGMVDIRIEMDARSNFPPLTTAYCLIIHDNLLHYCPATGIVHRDINI